MISFLLSLSSILSNVCSCTDRAAIVRGTRPHVWPTIASRLMDRDAVYWPRIVRCLDPLFRLVQSFHYSLGLFINELTHSFFRQIFFQKSFYFSLDNFHRINNSRSKDFRQESFVSRWTVVMFGVQVCENDILVVDVINRLPGKAAAIHWRGQSQLETPYMDGSPLVTQCPIPSYTTFQYKFRASAAGTHLWHAHAGN